MRKFLLIGSFIILIFVGLRFNSALFFSIKDHRCYAGDFLSDNYVASISDYISFEDHKKLSAPAIIDKLKKQFPIIDTIVIAFRPSGVHVKIEPYEPICCINDSLVLTSHNELFSKSIFSSQVLGLLPAVNVVESSISRAAQLLPDVLSMLPADFNSKYNLTLINEHYVRLADKTEPQFSVVFAVEQKNYLALLEQCEIIKKSYRDRGAFDRGMEWIADTRFAHYIVAYKA